MAESPRSDAAGPTQVASRRMDTGTGRAGAIEDGFSGWAWFAGGVLGLVGLFQVLAGILALAKSSYYTVPPRALAVHASYTTWGWVHLIIGLLALVTGGGLVFGSMIARVAGVALAVLSAVVNLAFLPAAPFVAAIVIGMDVLVIYAITVHGGEPRQAR